MKLSVLGSNGMMKLCVLGRNGMDCILSHNLLIRHRVEFEKALMAGYIKACKDMLINFIRTSL